VTTLGNVIEYALQLVRATALLIMPTIVALALLLGCRSNPSFQPTRAALIGEYVYHSADSGAPHAPHTLILKADGTYTLVHRKPRFRSDGGNWRYVQTPVPSVLLDSAGYEVQALGDDVTLVIDKDLGHSYKKVK
jgi:hypothetical protein